MVDLDQMGVDGPIELQFDGEMKIEENIISDWCGHGISASIFQNPYKVTLNSAYPNPFNPVTNIQFSIPVDAKVILEVYDINGNNIETLFSSNIGSGYHDVSWDASSFASGIYFITMRSDSFVSTQKVMLVK